jgi:hypothetical protein
MRQHAKYIRWFGEITIGDVPLVGGKSEGRIHGRNCEALG